MKKFIAGLLLAGAIAGLNFHATAEAAENPSCIMLKFTDDTRFDRVDSAGTLSDMVMEKLLNSGKFNFKETKVVDSKIEELLYNEHKVEFENAKKVAWGANANALFEGEGFAEERAETIDTARLGQIVSPNIIKSIGSQNGADYIIQGTIINLGTGNWLNEDLMKGVMYANQAMSVLSMAGPSAAMALGPLAPLASLASSISIQESGVGVQADLRIIKVETGEVIWQKRLLGKNMKKQIGVGFIKVGSTKLSNEVYYKAMEDASTKFADAIIADAEAGTLFVK